MKKLDNNQPIKCNTVEDLLIKQAIEKLSAEENSLLQNHLKICTNCKEFQNHLVSMQVSMKIDRKSQLKPDAAIRQRLIKRMGDFKRIKYRSVDSAWQRLTKLLEYRIPVYQGLIGLAGSLLIFWVINSFSFSNQHRSVSPTYHTSRADTSFYQVNIFNNLQVIEQQKIGKNASEDTLLTRFIVTSL